MFQKDFFFINTRRSLRSTPRLEGTGFPFRGIHVPFCSFFPPPSCAHVAQQTSFPLESPFVLVGLLNTCKPILFLSFFPPASLAFLFILVHPLLHCLRVSFQPSPRGFESCKSVHRHQLPHPISLALDQIPSVSSPSNGNSKRSLLSAAQLASGLMAIFI